jgi:hypothetical protein
MLLDTIASDSLMMGVALAKPVAPKRNASPERITPHLRAVLSHPRGETQIVSPHRDTLTGNQQATYSNVVGRNSPSFAPREKRKKFHWGEIQKLDRKSLRVSSGTGSFAQQNVPVPLLHAHHTKVLKTQRGVLSAFA